MGDCKNSTDICVLCLEHKRSPVHIQCGHSFCCGCLDIYISYKDCPWSSKCPICRHVLKDKSKNIKCTDQHLYSRNSTVSSMAENQSNSSVLPNHSVMSQENNILENFVTLATSYFDDDDTDDDNNTIFDVNFNDSTTNITQESENFDDDNDGSNTMANTSQGSENFNDDNNYTVYELSPESANFYAEEYDTEDNFDYNEEYHEYDDSQYDGDDDDYDYENDNNNTVFDFHQESENLYEEECETLDYFFYNDEYHECDDSQYYDYEYYGGDYNH